MKTQRSSWDEYFLKLAILVSERATCPRLHVGCVIVKDNQVISTGYNGSLPGHEHCEEVGCWVVEDHCIRTIHAEQNAVLQAARLGYSLDGSTCYATTSPCFNCAKSLIASGVKRIVTFSEYKCNKAESFIIKSGVKLITLPMPKLEFNFDLTKYSSLKRVDTSKN